MIILASKNDTGSENLYGENIVLVGASNIHIGESVFGHQSEGIKFTNSCMRIISKMRNETVWAV